MYTKKKSMWKSLEKGQKIILIGGSIFLVLLIAACVINDYIIDKPKDTASQHQKAEEDNSAEHDSVLKVFLLPKN